MKRIFALLQYIMRPAIAIGLACLLVGPLLAAESAGEMKLQKARVALTGEQKDTVQAKKLLLEIVEKDKDTLDSQSLCYVYVYLGYIEDRAGNRNEAIPWYQKALKIKDADRVQECATFGLEKPLTWIRHLDENATPPPRQQNSPAEAKLQQAQDALHGEPKNADLAKKLLLEILEHDKNTLASPSLCYVYVYLGYIEDRAGNRNEAVAWYKKALEIKDADMVRECAALGLEKPLTWIRHLDEGTEKISLESAPPVVVRTVPMAGGAGVDPALTEIRATYSKPMQDGSWSWSIWNEENYPETIGKPRYLSDGCTCVLPVNLKPDKFYAIWLNNDKSKNFTDTNGKPAVPYLLTFRTGTSTGAGEQRLKALVENFFAHNYRDITARDTIEWGQVSTDDKGNSSIRCQYRAKIWNKDTVTNNQVFTFDPQDKFVSVKDVATAASPTHP
jgi:RNA polymerase sigma-70 factor (ECF subfamily)